MSIPPLEKPLLQVLTKLAEYTGNYGIAIILLTIILRLIILPLTLTQERSMKKVREIQPELEKIKEKYKSNPQEMQIKVQELYKKNNVNPLGGCLPLIVQMLVFITLYTVLRNPNSIPSDATFLWFNLKQPDALFTLPFNIKGAAATLNVLPIANMIITYFQQKTMSAGTNDTNPSMKSFMYMMPVMLLVITYTMPSGVSLYWFTSSLLAVIQQLYIMKGRKN